jgi:hypothetical protein
MIGWLYTRARNKFEQLIDVLTFGPTRRKLEVCSVRLEELAASMAALQDEMRRVQALQDEMKRIEVQRESPPGCAMPLIVVDSISQDDVLDFFRQFAPFEVDGHDKIRLGNDRDGGYIFINDFADVSAVISCGIGDDVTCDYAFAQQGKTVLQFDHTVDGPPMPHERFQFHKQAIDAFGIIPGSVKLWDVVEATGDPSKADLLLKIDIEGDEWMTFANFPSQILKRFRQISCEFHGSSRLPDPASHTLYLRAIKNISASFFPAHLHANNSVGFANVMGVAVPEVFEVTFVNRDLYRQSSRLCTLPAELDRPNYPGFPDLFLGSPFTGA